VKLPGLFEANSHKGSLSIPIFHSAASFTLIEERYFNPPLITLAYQKVPFTQELRLEVSVVEVDCA
jgi:hypothetical protein